jgi:predicted enzyme related to lactoylglutathione lyase
MTTLVQRGGTALMPPFGMITGRMAVLQDPRGAIFAVLNRKPM